MSLITSKIRCPTIHKRTNHSTSTASSSSSSSSSSSDSSSSSITTNASSLTTLSSSSSHYSKPSYVYSPSRVPISSSPSPQIIATSAAFQAPHLTSTSSGSHTSQASVSISLLSSDEDGSSESSPIPTPSASAVSLTGLVRSGGEVKKDEREKEVPLSPERERDRERRTREKTNGSARNGRSTSKHPVAPKGRLKVKLIEARDLLLPSSYSSTSFPTTPVLSSSSSQSISSLANDGHIKHGHIQPYGLLQYDQAESISTPYSSATSLPTSPAISPALIQSPAQTGFLRIGNLEKRSVGVGMVVERRVVGGGGKGREGEKVKMERTKSGLGVMVGGKGGVVRKEMEVTLGGIGTPGGRSDGEREGRDPKWDHEAMFDVISDNRILRISIYDKSVATPSGSTTSVMAKKSSVGGIGNDSNDHGFLGLAEIEPELTDGWEKEIWLPLRSQNSDQVVSGQVLVYLKFEKVENKKRLSPEDFEVLKRIGEGSFGQVYKVRKKDTKRIYAMKVLSKKSIMAQKFVDHVLSERRVLQRTLDCRFLVGLKFSFQTERELFFVMDYKSGGELFRHLQRDGGRFEEGRVRFYLGEIVLALEYLHNLDIIYRDLKPENCLLDATGHISLCDFGLSKLDVPVDGLTKTFCGTTEYLAPEILLEEGYNRLVDFWSLGVLLFEMCCGWSPFYAEERVQKYMNILEMEIKIPNRSLSAEGKDLLKKLLTRDPAHRIGSRHGAAEIKQHPFFASIDWKALSRGEVTPPFKPPVDADADGFDFTSKPVLISSGVNGYSNGLGSGPGANGRGSSGTNVNHFASRGGGGGYDEFKSRRSSVLGGLDLNGIIALPSGGGGGLNSPYSPTATLQKNPFSKSVQGMFRGFTFSRETSESEPLTSPEMKKDRSRLSDVFEGRGSDVGVYDGFEGENFTEDEDQDMEGAGNNQGQSNFSGGLETVAEED